MLTKLRYASVELTVEVMIVNVEGVPDRSDCHGSRLKFISNVQFKFPLGLFAHELCGSNDKCNAVFCMENGDSKTSNNFIGA